MSKRIEYDNRNCASRDFAMPVEVSETSTTKTATTHKFIDESPINGLCDACGSSVQFHAQPPEHDAGLRDDGQAIRWSYRSYGDENYQVLDHFGNVVATGIKTDTTAREIALAVPAYEKLVAALEQARNVIYADDLATDKAIAMIDEALKHARKGE
jgi:hypothetical protein